MEVSECTNIVLNRIEKFEPENATKIMGYLLLNHPYEEILKYALGSDKKIISLILEAKSYLMSAPRSFIPPRLAPQCIPFPVTFIPQVPPFELAPSYGNSQLRIPPNMIVQPNSTQLNHNLCTDSSQVCHYYLNKGYCKNGPRCRFMHDLKFFPVGDWMRLEMEIRDILLSRGRVPLSIASLPMVYLERYGKVLQAEGYLTESQRHSKLGYSLSMLLAQLRTIALIERYAESYICSCCSSLLNICCCCHILEKSEYYLTLYQRGNHVLGEGLLSMKIKSLETFCHFWRGP
jgi:Zinc finger C-x8-C-x5-C-x3-H type (and similar)/OST-HTH/LOTUS domain